MRKRIHLTACICIHPHTRLFVFKLNICTLVFIYNSQINIVCYLANNNKLFTLCVIY